MGLLASLLLGALGVGVAAANTNDYAENQAYVPPVTSQEAEASRLLRTQPQPTLRPSDKLGPCEWVRLCHELGYWADPSEPVEVFWARVRTWDDQHEAQSAASAAHPLSASPSSQSAPESETLPSLLREEDGRATGPVQ